LTRLTLLSEVERKKGKEATSLIQIPKSIIALSICILKYLKADGIYLNSLLSLIRLMARFGC